MGQMAYSIGLLAEDLHKQERRRVEQAEFECLNLHKEVVDLKASLQSKFNVGFLSGRLVSMIWSCCNTTIVRCQHTDTFTALHMLLSSYLPSPGVSTSLCSQGRSPRAQGGCPPGTTLQLQQRTQGHT